MNKKQRREAALAKRERFMEEHKRSGLAALQKDRERRERIKRKIEADAKAKKVAEEKTGIIHQMHAIHEASKGARTKS